MSFRDFPSHILVLFLRSRPLTGTRPGRWELRVPTARHNLPPKSWAYPTSLRSSVVAAGSKMCPVLIRQDDVKTGRGRPQTGAI